MINKSKTPTSSPDCTLNSVAIVGAGLAGLSAAILLQQMGCQVTLFEKSRGPGGRLSAKRVKGGSADMGAQYFTIRNPQFRHFLDQYAGSEAYAPWHGRFGYQLASGQWEPFPDEERYVGVPRMTAISRALSENINLVAETRIENLHRESGGWVLQSTGGTRSGPFDAVVITAPPAQARELLANSQLTDLAARLDEPVRHVQPCWAVAAHFPEPPFESFDGMRVRSEILSWVGNNSTKPGRNDSGQWWVLHAASEWSLANQDEPAEEVADRMIDEFMAVTGAMTRPDDQIAHRWLYAKSSDPARPGHLWFSDERIGLAGDWLSGGRVEGAFDSASALVRSLTMATYKSG